MSGSLRRLTKIPLKGQQTDIGRQKVPYLEFERKLDELFPCMQLILYYLRDKFDGMSHILTSENHVHIIDIAYDKKEPYN